MVVVFELVVVSLFAFFWARRDTKAASRKAHVESFVVLMGVFCIALVLASVLDVVGSDLFYMYPRKALFLEELVKIVALMLGLGFAGKRFNELSDGVIYAVFAALGFIFYENLTYIQPVLDYFNRGFTRAVLLIMGRSVFTFAAHLFTAFFGILYAFAYLRSSKTGGRSRVKPWQIFKHMKILLKQFGWVFLVWIPFSPFTTLWKFFSRTVKRFSIPELLWSGFFASAYLHIGYDAALAVNRPVLSGIILFVVGSAMYALYRYFPLLDVKVL